MKRQGKERVQILPLSKPSMGIEAAEGAMHPGGEAEEQRHQDSKEHVMPAGAMGIRDRIADHLRHRIRHHRRRQDSKAPATIAGSKDTRSMNAIRSNDKEDTVEDEAEEGAKPITRKTKGTQRHGDSSRKQTRPTSNRTRGWSIREPRNT